MNLLENLGIQILSVNDNQTKLSLPVTDKIKQPYGLVHGGINAVLAETAASLGGNKWLEENQINQITVGINISTHHLLPVKDGKMTAIATAIKQGKRVQTWQVNIRNNNQLISTSIVTLMNIDKA